MQTTTEFFGGSIKDLLPALAPLGGVMKVDIEGEGGGVWYLDLDVGTVSRSARTPNVIVRAQWGDFLALIEGKMSVEDGLLTERLHLAGDATRLFRLAEAVGKKPRAQA